MTKLAPFQAVVDALLDETKPFPNKYLPLFSDIDPASLDLLMGSWPTVPPARKRTLMADLESLHEHDTIASFEDLARALLDDADASVRAAAIRLLAESEDAKQIPLLEKILASDPESGPRIEAANMLGKFVFLGELEVIPAATLHRIEEALLASLRGNELPAVKRRALESLGYSSRPEVPAQIEDAYDRQDPEWTASALVAMGRSADDRWEEQTLQSLLSENDKVRKAAVAAVGEIGLALARQPLLLLLNEEENEEVFFAAVWSLSQIGGEDVRDVINALADETDDDEELDFYEEALANLAFTEDLEALDMLALDPDDDLFELDEGDEEE